MKTPLITVLMPVYNAEKYIRQAIESILKQTFTDFEFLIIDDGSTDLSVKIIQSYTDPRIRLIQNEKNIGISATLNRGIELSATELIARMDADDISYPERLQKQYNYLKTDDGCALLSAGARVISKDGKLIRIDKYPAEYYYYNLNFICWIYHSTVMFRRSSVKDVGMYSVPYSEDFDLWWKISRNHKIHHLQEVLLDYRETAESLSTMIKRDEYETAQHQQVIRNVQYYIGTSGFSLSNAEIESLRFNFQPLLLTNDVGAIIAFFRKLRYISKRISRKDNINLNKKAVEEAYKYKKAYTLTFFISHLSTLKLLWLFIRIGSFRQCCSYIKMLCRKQIVNKVNR